MEQATEMPFLLQGHDQMRKGLGDMKSDTRASHPVEHIQKTQVQDNLTRKIQTMRRVYGSAMPARLQIESQLVSRSGRMGALPSSGLGMDTLMGKLDDFSFESYLGLPEHSTDMPVDFHSMMEKELKLGLKEVARGI